MSESKFSWGDEKTKFFFELTPAKVLDAVEATGIRCTGRCMPLNSMENRVYDIEIEWEEDRPPEHLSERFRVVKFYRPGRWTKEQIEEEHQFLFELNESEVPAIAPLKFPDGTSISTDKDSGIYYTVFPKVGGRAPQELDDEQLKRVGRLQARIHNRGSAGKAPHRIKISPEVYGRGSLAFLKSEKLIPPQFESKFETAVQKICDLSEPGFEKAEVQRIHGDCHFGNLLWNDQGPFFLDFDDMVNGPCIQDLWLICPGRDEWAKNQFKILLEAYEEMREFDRTTLKLVEPLRALRMIHFSAWMGKRWEDPAFPAAFPQYGTEKYWGELTQDLEDQVRLIQQNSY